MSLFTWVTLHEKELRRGLDSSQNSPSEKLFDSVVTSPQAEVLSCNQWYL